jgi:hypothetical protein
VVLVGQVVGVKLPAAARPVPRGAGPQTLTKDGMRLGARRPKNPASTLRKFRRRMDTLADAEFEAGGRRGRRVLLCSIGRARLHL